MPIYQNSTPPYALSSGDVGFSFNNEAFPGANTAGSQFALPSYTGIADGGTAVRWQTKTAAPAATGARKGTTTSPLSRQVKRTAQSRDELDRKRGDTRLKKFAVAQNEIVAKKSNAHSRRTHAVSGAIGWRTPPAPADQPQQKHTTPQRIAREQGYRGSHQPTPKAHKSTAICANPADST
jgi:hypothetical protein